MNTIETESNRTIDLGEFKAHCLEILDQLAAPGVIITKEGRPVARIIPISTVNNESLIGSMKGQISINGDIFSTT